MLLEEFPVRVLDDTMRAKTLRFIESWNVDDVYDRFGSAGIGGQEWLATEVTQHERSALLALNGSEVIGLLDHVYAQGAIHIGIVVDPQFRKLSIGTNLITSLLRSKSANDLVVAQCAGYNQAAIVLLRGCHFQRIAVDCHDMIWQHE